MEDYLQDGFDARSVTIPRLRSILVTHGIDFPSTAKKTQLVELVNEQILPQVPRIRAQRERAVRSSFGIVNAGSPEDIPNWADQDLAPPTTTPRRSKSPRKSSAKVKKEYSDEDEGPLRSPRKRAVRASSRQLSVAGDEEPQPDTARAGRRSRRTITPQIKDEPEDSEPQFAAVAADDRVFTDDNPFQSGSSPTQGRPSSSRRRTTGDGSGGVKSNRRLTGEVVEQPRSRKSYQAPPARSTFKTPESSDESEVSEDDAFGGLDPEDQLQAEATSNRSALVSKRRESSRPSRSFAGPLVVLLLTLCGAYLAWYRQETIAVGYCGLGRPANEVPSWVPDPAVPLVEPPCQQCPKHAYCYADFEARCEPDFVLQPHPLSLWGLVPLPPSCEPDGEKARRVQTVANKAVEELRERRAKFECGEPDKESGEVLDSPAIEEQELKATVSRKRSKRLNSQEFEELWIAALGEITAREEVEVQTTQSTKTSDSPSVPERQLSSTSLARLSLTCTVKRSLRLGLARYRLPAGLLVLLAVFALYARTRYHRHLAISAQVPPLADLVLGRLSNQKALGEEDIEDPWLFLPNLRDDVLRSVHKLSERERIWQKVKKVVEQNSNVRTSQREGRSGEVGRAWEWIGPVAGDGIRRRKSGRVSWGPDVKSESPDPSESKDSHSRDEPRSVF